MADFADLGADREERDRALALKVRAPEGPSATGMCLCCGEPLPVCAAVVRRLVPRYVAGRAEGGALKA